MQSDPIHPQKRVEIHGLTVETPADIESLLEACVRENPCDVDAIPYYAFLWPSARGLADYLAKQPDAFFKDKNFIELGCGLGLPSMLAARRGAKITATDFHPDVEAWLTRNVALNGLSIPFRRLDWAIFFDPLLSADWSVVDCVIGSDLLYERRHIPALVRAITCLTKCAIISDPGREHLQLFIDTMEKAGWRYELHPEGDIFVLQFTPQ